MQQNNFFNFPENPLENGFEKVKNKIEFNKKAVQDLLKIKNKTFDNFILEFRLLDIELDKIFIPIYHVNHVENSEESQEIYTKILPILSEYNTELSQNEEIFTVFNNILKTESNLNREQIKFLEESILSFKLSGIGLEKENKDRIKEINLKLSELSNNFSQNLLNATNSFEMILDNFEDVKELPENDLKSAEFKDENGQIKYKFTLQMPSYLAYITYGSNRKYREEIYKAYTSRSPENAKIIEEILTLKTEKANILGFKNYAELSLAFKMANSSDEVLEFLEELAQKSKKQSISEVEEIKNFSKLDDFNSFDFGYFSEKYKKENYSIDEEFYSQFFEQKNVVNGMFEFLKELFKIEFRQVSEPHLWNDKVTVYDVFDDDKLQGRLYLDLEARKTKRGGAWMNDWFPYYEHQNQTNLSQAFVVCNFAPSNAEKNIPSLLKHDDVVTLFHEMGHAIHHLMSKVKIPDLSGVNGVEWDAVEFPSQFLESFAYEPSVLQRFAKHHITGKSLTNEEVEKLNQVRNFQSAYSMLRQLEFGIFDMKLHKKSEKSDFSEQEVQTLLDSIRSKISPIIPPSYNKFQNGFSHIFSGGYSAGYYSYKWAEVLSADLFIEFKNKNIFDFELAEKYKKEILEKGSSQSMSELFVNLLGRKPKTEAILKLSNIK
jgi:oligopeptidase A